MQAGSNEDLLRLMRRKSIREHFLPPEEPYYRKASVALDAYGLGRTIQYLLAMSEPDPPLGRRETAKLQKLISRCLKLSSGKPIQSISEIRKYIPVYQETQKRAIQKGRKILVAAALLTALGALGRWGISGIRDGDARALAAGEEAGEGSGENVNEAETSGEINFCGGRDRDNTKGCGNLMGSVEASSGTAGRAGSGRRLERGRRGGILEMPDPGISAVRRR